MHYLTRITPERRRTTALTVANSLYMGVGGFVGNRLGGIVIDTWGIEPLYAGAAALAAVAALGFIAAQAALARREKSVAATLS